MLQLMDYQCENKSCLNVFEIRKKKPTESWPETVKCPVCGEKSSRVYSIINYDVSEGKLGNSKNNYSTGFKGYQQGMFGKVKGKRIK